MLVTVTSYLSNHSEEAIVGVLREALECHVEGLKEAQKAATTDRTIETPEDLTLVTGSMSEDIAIAEELLEAINVRATH